MQTWAAVSPTLTRRAILVSLAIGVAAGISSGLLGVGGGIVIVPLLVFAFRMQQHVAHATSLAAIVPIATVAAIPYAVSGNVDYAIAACLAVGGLVGAPLGAKALKSTDESTLKILFGLLMVGVAVELLWP
jgi:uncharacterized membrane protein YfcA